MKHWLNNLLLRIALWILFHTLGCFSPAASPRLAKWLARLFYALYRPGVRLIRANLKVFFPEKSERELTELLKKNLQYTFHGWLDFFFLLKNPELGSTYLENIPEELDATYPNPCIVCLPHLGCWELAAGVLSAGRPKAAAVAEIFDYPVINQLLHRSRTARGLKIIPRKGAAMGVLRALREGYSVGLLIDQNLSPKHKGIFAEFGGLPVTASPLPAIASRRMGIPIATCGCIRMPSGKFRVVMRNLVLAENASIEEITQTILSANEALIREYPEQYSWLYKRWSLIPKDISPEQKQRYPYYARQKEYCMYAKEADSVVPSPSVPLENG